MRKVITKTTYTTSASVLSRWEKFLAGPVNNEYEPKSAEVWASGSQSGGCATWSCSWDLTCLASRISSYILIYIYRERGINGLVMPRNQGHYAAASSDLRLKLTLWATSLFSAAVIGPVYGPTVKTCRSLTVPPGRQGSHCARKISP